MAFMTRLVFLMPAQRERASHGMLEAVGAHALNCFCSMGATKAARNSYRLGEAQADVEFSSIIIQT